MVERVSGVLPTANSEDYQGADAINLGQLSPLTQHALTGLVYRRFGWEINTWEVPERVAWMSYLLMDTPDSPEDFPKGKWATIQRLQAILRDAALRRNLAVAAPKEGTK